MEWRANEKKETHKNCSFYRIIFHCCITRDNIQNKWHQQHTFNGETTTKKLFGFYGFVLETKIKQEANKCEQNI